MFHGFLIKGLTSVLPRSTVSTEAKAKRVESLWRDFFVDPSEWLDNRSTKRNKASPDFVHCWTKEALWIDGLFNPHWVGSKLDLLIKAPDTRGRRAAYQDNDAKCGSLIECRSFQGVWRLCEKGQLDEAFQAVALLDEQGVRLTTIFAFLVVECTGKRNLAIAKVVDHLVANSAFASQSYLGGNLIRLFSACGSLLDACRVFERLPKPSVLAWSAILSAHTNSKEYKEAVKLYLQLCRLGVEPNDQIFLTVLRACIEIADLMQGRIVHFHTMECGSESDLYVGSCLMEMYAVWGMVKDSRKVFEKLAKQDIVSWTTMIGGYARHGYSQEALELFQIMQQQGVEPNAVTLVSVIKACSATVSLVQGKHVHSRVIECGCESDMYIGSSLIDMYIKCGQLQDAHKVYAKLPEKDTMLHNILVAGYAQYGQSEEAMQYFNQMQQESSEPNSITIVSVLQSCSKSGALSRGQLVHADMVEIGFQMDVFIFSTLIDMYAKCGSCQDARRVFDSSSKENAVIWTAMVAGYTLNGDHMSALESFEAMQQLGLEPDNVTFVSVLSACSHVGLLAKGCHFFQAMKEEYGILPMPEHFTCMIDLLGRTGCLVEAQDLAQTMPSVLNLEGWVSLLGNSKTYGDTHTGRHCLDSVLTLDPVHGSGYVLMSNMYHDADMGDDAHGLTCLRDSCHATKTPGKAFIKINTDVHEFVVGDKTHPQQVHVHAKLSQLNIHMKEEGYVLVMDQVTLERFPMEV